MALGGGRITVDDGVGTALLTVVADGLGAAGPEAADATGGTARLVAEDGTIAVVGDIELSASAAMADTLAATGGEGFDATGGNAGVEVLAGLLGTGSIGAGTLAVRANGDARLTLALGSGAPEGDPISGNGGDGAGGLASVTVDAGSLATWRLLLELVGVGGASAAIDALAPFTSGNGIGGTSLLTQNGGATTMTTLDVLSNGLAGGGAPNAGGTTLAAFAGNGTGGIATPRHGRRHPRRGGERDDPGARHRRRRHEPRRHRRCDRRRRWARRHRDLALAGGLDRLFWRDRAGDPRHRHRRHRRLRGERHKWERWRRDRPHRGDRSC